MSDGDFLDGFVSAVKNRGECWFEPTSSAGYNLYLVSDVGSTVTLGGIVMSLCF